MPSYKRRRFFIDKEYQGRYIFNAFLSVAIGSVLFALIIAFFSSNTLSIVYDDYHLRLGTTPELLKNKILSAQWLFIALGGGGVILIALFLSHRVAGPFFRFEQTLNQMASKDLRGRIQLRKRDEGKVLAGKFNEFNEMLSQNLGRMREISENIRQCCEDLPGNDDPVEKNDHLSSQLEKIRRYNGDCLEMLNEFKLK
jgi:methyl-accepting chemotaxis protein